MNAKPFFEFCFWSVVVFVIFYLQYHMYGGVYSLSDYYAQAVRVRDFLVSPTWMEVVTTRSNYPTGEILGGTRVYDIIWTLCTMPLNASLVLSLKVFYAGILSTIFGSIFLLFIFVFGTKKGLSIYARTTAIVLFILQMQIYSDFRFAAPEIFILIPTLLFIISWWGYDRKELPYYLMLMAISCAFLCWVNPLGILYMQIFLIALLVAWFMNRITAQRLFSFAGMLACSVSAIFFLDPPANGYDTFLLTRLSLYHVVVVWVFFIIINIFNALSLKDVFSKVFAAVVLSLLFGLGIYFVHKPQFQDAYAMYKNIYTAGIYRARLAKSLADYWIFYIYPIIAFGCGIYLLNDLRYQGKNVVTFVILIGVTIAMYFRLAPVSLSALVAVLIMALLLQRFYKYEGKVSLTFKCFAGGFIGIEFILLLLLPIPENNSKISKSLVSDISELMQHNNGTVLSDVMYSPLILWYTKQNVAATPNFSSQESVNDVNVIWMSEDMKEVKSLLDKHRVDYIFLPENYDDYYFTKPEENLKKFYARIIRGKNLPYWVKPITKLLRPNVYLYHVERDRKNEVREKIERDREEALAAERANELPDDLKLLLEP